MNGVALAGNKEVCDSGWFGGPGPAGGRCYQIIGRTITWEGADHMCKTQYPGSYLAEPATRSQQTFLSTMLTMMGGSGRDYWIGASDAAREGRFRWMAIGSDVRAGDAAWAGGREPTDHGKDCAKMSKSADGSYVWKDENCAGQHYAICQYTL